MEYSGTPRISHPSALRCFFKKDCVTVKPRSPFSFFLSSGAPVRRKYVFDVGHLDARAFHRFA